MNKQETPLTKVEEEIKQTESKLNDLGIKMSKEMIENEESKERFADLDAKSEVLNERLQKLKTNPDEILN